ncbi:FRG domain-containing protein, partial [Streptococcus danieliae]|nr:FRG domain-containing protein [Streptococcus danieliae]
NKRIKAQKGAFINFDKLVKFVNFQKNEIKLKDYRPIDRIILQIEFDKSMTIDYLKNQKEVKLNNGSEKGLEQIKDLSDKELDELIQMLENDDEMKRSNSTVDLYYSIIQKELLRKLKEF